MLDILKIVERRLQERLVGAAALAAVAIILIPEMLSGPRTTPTDAEQSADTVKTFAIELQKKSPRKDVEVRQEIAPRQSPPQAIAPAPSPQQQVVAPSAVQAPAEAVRAEPSASASVRAPAAKGESNGEAGKGDVKDAKDSKEAQDAHPVSASKALEAHSGWAVQVASLGSRAAAEQLSRELKRRGFPAFVMEYKTGGKTLFRTRVGPVSERQAADDLLIRIKKDYPAAALVTHP